MEFITELWMPIVVSAVLVFIASSIIHMALPIHKNDVKKMNNEDAVLEAMRKNGVGPGSYMFPCASSMKDMGSPEMVAKFEKGPVGFLTVLSPGGFNMGKSLGVWFIYCLIVGLLTAYIAWHALGGNPNAEYLRVFQITGTAAILGYAVGQLQNSIWKGVRWGVTMKFIFDGVVYGLITAGTFGWLWPHAG